MLRLHRKKESPLLFFFIEDAPASPRRPSIFANNRSSAGVSNVFSEWPFKVTSYVVATLIFTFFFTTLAVVLLGTVYPDQSQSTCKTPKICANSTHIFLAHHGEWQPHQLRVVEKIAQVYPGVPIELIELVNASRPRENVMEEEVSTTIAPLSLTEKNHYYLNGRKPRRILSQHEKDKEQLRQLIMCINVGNHRQRQHALRDLIELIPIRPDDEMTLETLLRQYPIVTYNVEVMSNFFGGTPLSANWQELDMEVLVFAARIQQLWKNGGISYKIPEPTKVDREQELGIETWVRNNLTSFQNLSLGVVDMDNEANRFETKTPRHLFFGDLLSNLKKGSSGTTVEDVVNATLKTCSLNGNY